MSIDEPEVPDERRTAPRIELELRTLVQVKEADNSTWKAVTDVTTISRNGAGFTLLRDCPIGRLVKLVLPMPEELRLYDKDKKGAYDVMAVVQNCYKSSEHGKSVYHIGVAFIGKTAPESFKANPDQGYRISGMEENGLWQVVEAERPFKRRRHARFWRRIDVSVSLKEKDTKSVSRANSYTRDVSETGMSIMAPFEAQVGERLKVTCKEYNFFSMAVIRNKSIAKDGTPTLHMEFIEATFPIEKLTFHNAPDEINDVEPATLSEDPGVVDVEPATVSEDPEVVDVDAEKA